jgi:hypothetical protein
MKEVKISYNFNKLKGKPKRLLENLGYKIKSYGVCKDTVTLIFLSESVDDTDKIISELKKLGISKYSSN